MTFAVDWALKSIIYLSSIYRYSVVTLGEGQGHRTDKDHIIDVGLSTQETAGASCLNSLRNNRTFDYFQSKGLCDVE